MAGREGYNTAPQSAPHTGKPHVRAYRCEPDNPPPLRRGECDWCGGPVSEDRKTCSPECRAAWVSFVTTLGRKIAVYALISRAQRPRRKGEPGGPAYRRAQDALRDLPDEALRRLRAARNGE